ncbi:MAG: transcriptional regulator NrdR [Spirochaeta sp.]|nr:transcriptional regulator NrdR [Spirochaeta sp.]
MRCPLCDSLEDKVIESRSLAGGSSIRRRRECLACGYRFTSYERLEDKQLMVVKRSDRREPFSREKLEKGLEQAVRKRAVPQLQIESIVNEIEEQAMLQARAGNEISSEWLGDRVLDALYNLDRVAYVRFASVYRNFTNVAEFITEIQKITSWRGAPGVAGPTHEKRQD